MNINKNKAKVGSMSRYLKQYTQCNRKTMQKKEVFKTHKEVLKEFFHRHWKVLISLDVAKKQKCYLQRKSLTECLH